MEFNIAFIYHYFKLALIVLSALMEKSLEVILLLLESVEDG